MTKYSIINELVRNSLGFLHQAHEARQNGRLDEEVRFSMGAILMIALAIEGTANEAGELVFEKGTWKKLEKTETPLKWQLISGWGGRKAFDPGREPLQTVSRLAKRRNEIAHPKPSEHGDDTIAVVVDRTGQVVKKASTTYVPTAGDTVHLIPADLHDAHNFDSACSDVGKAINAIKSLLVQIGFAEAVKQWVDCVQNEFTSFLEATSSSKH